MTVTGPSTQYTVLKLPAREMQMSLIPRRRGVLIRNPGEVSA